jgi:hypothetical protein
MATPFHYRRVVCLLLAIASPAVSAAPPNIAPDNAPLTPAALAHAQVTVLEADLATLLQRRLDAAGPELAIIDYQIDLRLLQRWMLSSAVDPKTPDAMQAPIALRIGNLQSAGDQIAQRLQNSGKALTAGQLEGLHRLHDLTYKLPSIKSLGTIDETCKAVTTALILAANPSPAEVNHLPIMRPKWSADASPTTAPAPRSLAELKARAKEVKVSPALRRELLALSDATELAAITGKDPEEAAMLFEALSTVTDLTDGLERNVGIDPAARPKVELQLTEGVALFTDPRTRSSGINRIAALNQYRATLFRIQQLHLPDALLQKLGPAFIWVNNNPESAAPVLGSIEKYIQLCTRADARKEAQGIAPTQKKSLDLLQLAFDKHRIAFIQDSANLGSNLNFVATSPGNLAEHIDVMTDTLGQMESIEALPRAIQIVLAMRPKPTGAIERKLTLAYADMSTPTITATHDASLKFIADAEKLAQLADTPGPPPGMAPAALKAYTHDRFPGVQTRRTAILTGLASQLATGREMDAADMSKMQILHDLMDSLVLDSSVEICLAKADVLNRWADWSITPAQIRALVAPYRDATASAFDGFADDNATPLFRWPDQHKRYLPILLLAREAGSYADQCADMPAGLPGDFARLLTPMEKQPFATERNASLAVILWQASAAANDPKLTDNMFDAMLAGLRKDFGMEEKSKE